MYEIIIIFIKDMPNKEELEMKTNTVTIINHSLGKFINAKYKKLHWLLGERGSTS